MSFVRLIYGKIVSALSTYRGGKGGSSVFPVIRRML